MCDENQSPKARKYVSYADVQAAQQKILDQFILELQGLRAAGASLRDIAKMKEMNHETVRKLLKSKEGYQTYTRA